jgi:hypothetical protein
VNGHLVSKPAANRNSLATDLKLVLLNLSRFAEAAAVSAPTASTTATTPRNKRALVRISFPLSP